MVSGPEHEDRLTQCQEQIADLNTTVASLLKDRLDLDRRVRKLERRVGPAMTKVFQ